MISQQVSSLIKNRKFWFTLSCCFATCFVVNCGSDLELNDSAATVYQAIGASNGPGYNGPGYNGPGYNGPGYNGPSWGGAWSGLSWYFPGGMGPAWNAATDIDDTLVFGNSEYHERWVTKPFSEATLRDPDGLRDVLCNPADAVTLDYMWRLAFDSNTKASFTVNCESGWIKYDFQGSLDLAPQWKNAGLMAPGSSTCSSEAAFLSAGWLSLLNSAPSKNAPGDGLAIHNPLSIRGNTQGPVSQLYSYSPQMTTYHYGAETVKAIQPMPAASTYANFNAQSGGWMPGGVFKVTVTSEAGASIRVRVSQNSTNKPVVLGIARGLHMADWVVDPSGGDVLVEGHKSTPQIFTSTAALPTKSPSLTTQNLPPGEYFFSYSYRPFAEVDKELFYDASATLKFGILVASGTATITTREHEIFPWEEGSFWGCIFGTKNRNTAGLGFVNNITANVQTHPCVEMPPSIICGSMPGPTVSKCASSNSYIGVAADCPPFAPAPGKFDYWNDAHICISSNHPQHSDYAQARGCSNAVFNDPATIVCYMKNADEPCERACSSTSATTFHFETPAASVNLGDNRGCQATPENAPVNEVVTTFLNAACDAVNGGIFAAFCDGL